jgi:hypothetical protein
MARQFHDDHPDRLFAGNLIPLAMPYQPSVQNISGQLLAQGMQARAQGIAGGVQTLFQGLQQNQMMTGQALARFQAATAANPKLLDFLNQGGSGQSPVPVNPEILKAYADIKAGKTNVQNTSLLAQFADTYNQAEFRAAELSKVQLANQKAQQQLDQLKKLGEIYSSMGNAPIGQPAQSGQASAPATPSVPVSSVSPATKGSKYRRVDGQAESADLQRGTGEMALLNSLRRFSPQDESQGMVGAAPFEFKALQSLPQSGSSASAELPAAVPASAPTSAQLSSGYDVPPPPVPPWFNETKASSPLGMDLNLSPEAKAIAVQLRRQYEESQDPSLRTISAPDLEPRKRKSITLDAEGIKAILSNPRILVESFSDVAGDVYQQGLRRERLDRMMREQEQLRTLERMMRSTRRGR